MKNLGLGQAADSFYFWPAVAFLAVAVFFFGWAVLMAGGDWAGQAMWGAIALLIGLLLLGTAARESRRVLLRS